MRKSPGKINISIVVDADFRNNEAWLTISDQPVANRDCIHAKTPSKGPLLTGCHGTRAPSQANIISAALSIAQNLSSRTSDVSGNQSNTFDLTGDALLRLTFADPSSTQSQSICPQRRMRLLDASGIFRRDAKSNLSDVGDFPAALSRKRDRECTDPRAVCSATQTFLLSGSRNTDQHIALGAKCVHLALEDSFVPVVVPDRGQNGCVGRQRN